MTLEEIKALKNLTIHQIEPDKKYLIVFDVNAIPMATAHELLKGFTEFFGAKAAFVRKSPAGEFTILEIKP